MDKSFSAINDFNTTNFEEALVQSLLIDHAYAEQMIEVLDPDFFTLAPLQAIAQRLISYYNQYKKFPSLMLLEDILTKHEGHCSELVRNQIRDYFSKIKTKPLNGDGDYVKANALEFCRKQKVLSAMEKCLELAETRNFDQIANEIQTAVHLGSERNIGHVYDTSFEERMQEARRTVVATPWDPLNRIIAGGLSAGELGVILALTGVGKSHALIDLGVAAALAGLTVVHYTFELKETIIGKRYDARISGIAFDDLAKNKSFVKECVDMVKGKIIIRKYPNRQATVANIKHHVHKLRLNGINPDIIVVDYADIMKSSKNYSDKRHEEEAVYEELRGLADELNVPIWTASQTNRSGMDVDVLTLKHIAECFNKANISDLFITMNRKKTGERETIGNMFVAKSRIGVDGVKFNIAVDTALSKITCFQPGSDDEKVALLKYDLLAEESDEERLQKRIRTMFKNSPTNPRQVAL
jgi:replicative DNA helicase